MFLYLKSISHWCNGRRAYLFSCLNINMKRCSLDRSRCLCSRIPSGPSLYPARAPVTHSAPELDPSRSEWVRACHSAAPPLRYLHPAQNRPNPHIRHIHRYTGITPKTGAKSYFSCLCWGFKGTCVDLVGSKRKKMKGRMIKMTDVLGFESSWTMVFLCALVPLPARSDITCASCLAPTRRNEAHAKATAFISRDFGSAPDGSTEWKWRLDGAQLSPEAHKKSPFVSWREKLQNAHISRAERTSPAEEKDGKVYPTEETKVNRREKRNLYPSDSAAGSRFEFRRTGGVDGTGKSPRQNEPHLITSTFALSGDSAHNQAMVLWSGHNSSVSVNFIQRCSL